MTIDASDLKKLEATRSNYILIELKKRLYGLKKSGMLWSQLLYNCLVESGYTRSMSDLYWYYKQTLVSVVIVGVYADDLLVTGTSIDVVEKFFLV